MPMKWAEKQTGNVRTNDRWSISYRLDLADLNSNYGYRDGALENSVYTRNRNGKGHSLGRELERCLYRQ